MKVAPNEGLFRLLDRLHGVTHPEQNRWIALCPCHDDHHPSLCIDVVWRGRAKPLIICNACGAGFREVLKRVELRGDELMRGLAYTNDHARKPVARGGSKVRRVEGFLSDDVYRDLALAQFRLLGDEMRLSYLKRHRGLRHKTVEHSGLGFDGAAFVLPIYRDRVLVNVRRYLPEGDPKWRGLPGRAVELYPDIRDTAADDWVLWVEGELDALKARQHGLPAFTQTGGALARLRPHWHTAFVDKNVAIAYDCDEPGRIGAQRAASDLRGIANRIKVVDLGLGDSEDVTDWFVTHERSAADLKKLIKRTSDWTGARRR